MILKGIVTVLTIACPLTSLVAYGQTAIDSLQEKAKVYHEQPVWIDMMGDPNVNYFEACRAFDTFWEGREIPAETEGEANALYVKGHGSEDEHEKEKRNETYSKEEHEEKEGLHFKDPFSYTMIYEYKRFINWRYTMRDKVDPVTGQLLNSQTLEAIWQSQTQGIDTHIR